MSAPAWNFTMLRARELWALVVGGMVLIAASGCGGGSSSTTSSSSGSSTTTTTSSVNNTLPVSVNGGPFNNDVDVMFASVTVCVHGTTTCQTIPDVAVDTGSSGLRLLASALTISLPTVSDSAGNPLGNCITFTGNTYAWGAVATADVQLAGETASSLPIQIINPNNFPAAPDACSAGLTNTTAQNLGANGLLGIGLFQQDCGSACATAGLNLPPIYFGCPSSGCVEEAVSLQQQVQNPVGLFAQDNNGVVIDLPALDASGDPTATGSVLFGIGTQSDNALSAVQIYTTDDNGYFTVTFNGQAYSESFLDTGSNGFFLLSASTLGVPTCPVNTSFYCPATTVSYSAVTTGTNGTSNTIAFSLANANTLFNTGNTAFNNIGGPGSAGMIDLGLPFFFGRPVYVAIQGASTSSGSGPYWAF